MTEDPTILTGTPIHPSTDRFTEYDLLLSHFHCWEEARGSHMIPLKRDYEGAMLEHPEILPNLSFMEIISPVDFRYLYQGNLRVIQQCQDWTNKNFLEAFAPGAKRFVMDWTSANIARPFLALWTDRTLLQSGSTMVFTALTCALADDNGARPAPRQFQCLTRRWQMRPARAAF